MSSQYDAYTDIPENFVTTQKTSYNFIRKKSRQRSSLEVQSKNPLFRANSQQDRHINNKFHVIPQSIDRTRDRDEEEYFEEEDYNYLQTSKRKYFIHDPNSSSLYSVKDNQQPSKSYFDHYEVKQLLKKFQLHHPSQHSTRQHTYTQATSSSLQRQSRGEQPLPQVQKPVPSSEYSDHGLQRYSSQEMNPYIISFSLETPFKARMKSINNEESVVEKVLRSDKNLRIRNHLTGLMKTVEAKVDQKTGMSSQGTKTIFSSNNVKEQLERLEEAIKRTDGILKTGKIAQLLKINGKAQEPVKQKRVQQIKKINVGARTIQVLSNEKTRNVPMKVLSYNDQQERGDKFEKIRSLSRKLREKILDSRKSKEVSLSMPDRSPMTLNLNLLKETKRFNEVADECLIITDRSQKERLNNHSNKARPPANNFISHKLPDSPIDLCGQSSDLFDFKQRLIGKALRQVQKHRTASQESMNKAEELKKENFKLQAQVNRYRKIATEKLKKEKQKNEDEDRHNPIDIIDETHDQLKNQNFLKKSNESQVASGTGVSDQFL